MWNEWTGRQCIPILCLQQVDPCAEVLRGGGREHQQAGDSEEGHEMSAVCLQVHHSVQTALCRVSRIISGAPLLRVSQESRVTVFKLTYFKQECSVKNWQISFIMKLLYRYSTLSSSLCQWTYPPLQWRVNPVPEIGCVCQIRIRKVTLY